MIIPNIRNTFLILSCTRLPFCPQNSLNSSRHGLYKVSKVWPMLTPMLQQQRQVGWMSFGWLTILDTHQKLLCVKNRAALLTNPVRRHCHFCLAHSSPEWHTCTIHVSISSRLKNPLIFYCSGLNQDHGVFLGSLKQIYFETKVYTSDTWLWA